MEINTLEKINYRPSEPAKNVILKEKKKYPRKSFNQIIDECIINFNK